MKIAEYGIGDWKVDGRGNHRAVVRVKEACPVALAEICWRRHDENPETIVVESTKDMNGAERKKEIEREQRLEEDYRKKAVAELEKYFSDDKITDINIERKWKK